MSGGRMDGHAFDLIVKGLALGLPRRALFAATLGTAGAFLRSGGGVSAQMDCQFGEIRCIFCVDPFSDPRNCGGCGVRCPSDAFCDGGLCDCINIFQRLCGGVCTSTNTDLANCGRCGNACPPDSSCREGKCVTVDAPALPRPSPTPIVPPDAETAGSPGNLPAGTAAECWTAEQRLAPKRYGDPPAAVIDPTQRYVATLKTNMGTIEVELFPWDAPNTVNNFVCLAHDGYYDNTPFHRIVQGFVIQGGDPTGTGAGGPGYQFEDEPITRDYERGTLAMANAGPDTNGSQFFVVLDDLRGQLPKNYTIFGRVTAGQVVVDQIAAVPTRIGPSGEQSQPTEPVVIERVTVREQEQRGGAVGSPEVRSAR